VVEERVLTSRFSGPRTDQGLKPDIHLDRVIGTTEVMPCYEAMGYRLRERFFATLKVLIFLLAIYGAAEAVTIQNATSTPASQGACTPPDAMKAALAGKPGAPALNDLGLWYADKGQYACAADAFGSSLRTDSKQKDVAHITFMFGVSMDLSGDSTGAIGALKQAEQEGYRDIKLHLLLAATLDATQAPKDAEDEWRAALQMDPEYPAALDALSGDLLRDGDFDGVIKLLEVPRLKGQRTPQQSLNLAAAYEATGKLDGARGVLRDGLNTTPDSLPLATELAKVLVAVHATDEAGTVLYLAGVQQRNKGELEQARGLFERAIALGDNGADVRDSLAKVKAALGGG